MKWFWILASAAFAVLAFASVWLGGLNQDEGWYLYAARLMGEGQMPYADFAFTQGPILPTIYGALGCLWLDGGILAARVLTSLIGLLSLVFAVALARLLVPEGRKNLAGVVTFLLLGNNLYHLYYTSIPKTYALAALFVLVGFYLFALALASARVCLRALLLVAAGLSLAFAAGARISLGLLLAVSGVALLVAFRRYRWSFLWLGLGGFLGLALAYGSYLLDVSARDGLIAAQKYHAARGGFDPVLVVGSLSRLVRWYLPVFVLFGLGLAGAIAARRGDARACADSFSHFVWRLALVGFLAVFVVQLLAPFPYEDYQVPVMGLFAVAAVALALRAPLFDSRALSYAVPLLALGLTWAGSFGSPLLEGWMTNGQDRFWTRVKEKPELAQLRDMAKVIEAVDPGGKMLLTQDLYLAIETGRKVPKGLEMGPFSILSDDEWKNLLSSAPCYVAALSGYTFAIEPPRCAERPLEQQLSYWELLKKRYDLVLKEEAFGQHATTLLILKRKAAE